jgi:hypothetical protein
MKIFVNRSQESLEKNSWVPIAMLWYTSFCILNFSNVIFSEELRYITILNYLVHLKNDKSHTFIMYLVIFCVSLSLKELSELRGVRKLKSIFMKNSRGILEI